MKKSIIGIQLLLVIFYNSSSAQNDWRNGFIIEVDGDTIQGLIDYRNDKSNSKFCYFKKEAKDKTNKYSPTELSSFRFNNGKYYVSKKVQSNEGEKQVFLEFLIQGRANIFHQKTNMDLYYVEKEGVLYELKNSEILSGTDFKEKKEYIGTLNYVLQEANLQNDIYKSELNSESLINIAKKYHNKVCETEECIVFEKQNKPVEVNFGVTFGYNYNTLYLNRFLEYGTKIEFSNYIGGAIRVSNIEGVYDRFSAQIEILANKYFFEQKAKYALNIPLTFDYKILVTKLYSTVEFGVSSYFIKTDFGKTRHMTFLVGLSLNYELEGYKRFFINARMENNPKILRFGGGIIF